MRYFLIFVINFIFIGCSLTGDTKAIIISKPQGKYKFHHNGKIYNSQEMKTRIKSYLDLTGTNVPIYLIITKETPLKNYLKLMKNISSFKNDGDSIEIRLVFYDSLKDIDEKTLFSNSIVIKSWEVLLKENSQ